jgi:mannitol/fructose-specific phosphotransferase system IIA component (Ntr-type)
VQAHREHVFGRPDVAVADDRNRQRLRHGSDLVPVRRPLVHLRARPRVQRQRQRTGVLAPQRDLDRVTLCLVPAAADLHGDGQVCGRADRANDALHQPHVLEAAGAAVVADHLFDRAAEVDVYEVRLEQLRDHAGCLRHDLGVCTVDLDADGALDGLEPHLGEHTLDAERDADGGDELGHHDVGPKAAADLPEGRFRHPRHWGEEEREVVLDRVGEVHALERNNALRTEQPTFTFCARMRLREFFSEDAIKLELESGTKDGVLKELVGLLKLDDKAQAMLFKMLKRRETLGSTGIGQHIAIPHCRSLVVSRLRCAFGRSVNGIDFKAIDDQPVSYVFLIVAPPLEVSNQYLPVLGKIAQFAKESDVPARLAKLKTPAEFLALLEEKNI